MRCKDEQEDLPAWIIDRLPPPPSPPLQPRLEVPGRSGWPDPPPQEPADESGGTVIIIDL